MSAAEHERRRLPLVCQDIEVTGAWPGLCRRETQPIKTECYINTVGLYGLKTTSFYRQTFFQIFCLPADGLATTLHGSTFQINSPVVQPTASSLAKNGLHCIHDTPRCCLYFNTGEIPSPGVLFRDGTVT